MNNKYLLNKRDFFKENGYVIYKNILNKKNTSYYLKDLKKFALDKSQGKNLFLQGYHGLSKWKKIKQIRRNPKIKKIATSLLGTNIKNFGSELFAKKGPGTLPVPLHQDDAYWCSNGGRGLTLWLALTNVSKKNGGIFYLQGSHKKGLVPHQMAKTKKFSQTIKKGININKYKKISPVLRKGDCVVHSGLTIHGSKKNISNMPRVAITFRFIDKNLTFNKSRIKKYKKQLTKHRQITEAT